MRRLPSPTSAGCRSRTRWRPDAGRGDTRRNRAALKRWGSSAEVLGVNTHRFVLGPDLDGACTDGTGGFRRYVADVREVAETPLPDPVDRRTRKGSSCG